MTWKQVETSREIRLWITQVIVPVLGIGAAYVAAVPEAREKVAAKFVETKNRIKFKLR